MYWYANVSYDYSCFISVFLAVVRCLCVAKPLTFKSLITRARTLAVLISAFFIAIILGIAVFTVFRLASVMIPSTNPPFVMLALSRDYSEIYRVNDILNRTIISWLAYSTVIVWVVILLHKIYEASQFRRLMLTPKAAQGSSACPPKDVKSKESAVSGTSTSDSVSKKLEESKPASPKRQMPSAEKMSIKNLQVVQSVTLICIIFILSQLQFQVTSVYRLIESEFDNRARLSHLFQIANNVTKTCGLLNASVNIFVYIRYNSGYKETLENLFFAKGPPKLWLEILPSMLQLIAC
ncbi:chemosensory receptor c [Plakobranchus ocellatus]|uniref:Chemosensory receptor c n=1 Tax=Plakobranchus ocellatus TaxID=259542 RepID=A0AAV3YRH8_9GAST|nr:chemosensory receptor c [Plakobranchus ocellatus]